MVCRDRPMGWGRRRHPGSKKTVWEHGRPIGISQSPNSCAGPMSPHRAQGRARKEEAPLNQEKVFIGIDVAKARLDIALWPMGETWSVANTEEGRAAAVTRLQAMKPALVVLEATGGWELPVAGTLAAAGLLLAVVNPRQVVEMLTAEKNRLARAVPRVRPGLEAHIAWLQRQLAELDHELGRTLRESPLWREQEDLLRSVPGVGRT